MKQKQNRITMESFHVFFFIKISMKINLCTGDKNNSFQKTRLLGEDVMVFIIFPNKTWLSQGKVQDELVRIQPEFKETLLTSVQRFLGEVDDYEDGYLNVYHIFFQ